MSEVREALAAVVREHRVELEYAGMNGAEVNCWCGWVSSYDALARVRAEHAAHVAEEIDAALGGLRKLKGHGQLLPGGILTPVYQGVTHAPGTESKTYTQWISGWTEAT